MICRTEGGTLKALLIVQNEREMKKLKVLKVGGVQREGKKKHIL